jgi:GntR family transcriptional regulator/MocR family aminotransferase
MLSELLLTEMTLLSNRDKLPLHRQLYEAMRRAILSGKVATGERLPSSRDLTHDLQLSRNTVVAALNQLIAEGYLSSRVGSGTFVSASVPSIDTKRGRSVHHQPEKLSQRGLALSNTFCAADLEVQPFTPGIADFSAFPIALWQRLQNKHWRMTYPDMLDYSSSGGYGPLRRAIADYLRVFRSVPVDIEQVIVTSGTQESLGLCAQLLADPNDTVWIEDPAYWGAVKAFMATGLRMHGVPVDSQGIAPQAKDNAYPPKLIYVTPSHQYPTGAVMSLERRHQLLALTREHKAWVLEDDYDSEFRFSGPPISSLAGLDNHGQVIYLGSFSKVLYPGLKLGYMVVPKNLAVAFKRSHYDLNRPGQMPLQAALAEFIDMGHFASALRKARQSYGQRRQCLLAALQPCLGPQARITGAEQGLHLCLRLPDTLDDKALAQQLRQTGLITRPLSGYSIGRKDLKGLVIGYGYAPLAQIEQFGPVMASTIAAALGALGKLKSPRR